MNSMKWLVIFFALLHCKMLFSAPIAPHEEIIPGTNRYPINVSGIIVSSQCTLNGDRESRVNFGDIIIQLIDGIRFSKSMPFTVTCPGAFNGEQEVFISATAAAFDNNVISTTNANVGIKLILNGKDIEINKAHNIDWRVSNTLIAVPVKNKVKVTAGEFTATATMVLNVR